MYVCVFVCVLASSGWPNQVKSGERSVRSEFSTSSQHVAHSKKPLHVATKKLNTRNWRTFKQDKKK